MIKNLPIGEAVNLSMLVEYQLGQVVSRTLAQNKQMSVTLFAFAAGEGLNSHTSSGDALIYVLEGKALITIDTKKMTVQAGQVVVLPANIPHAVEAPTAFKMLLMVVKPEKT